MARQNDPENELVTEAQKQGIHLSQDEDGWHGSYLHDGHNYTLDGEQLEPLFDDMQALREIFTQDDTYSVDYNEDLDRYLVSVINIDEPFSDKVLAKAFARAKEAVMVRMRDAEEERRKRSDELDNAQAQQNREEERQRARGNGPAELTGGDDLRTQIRDLVRALQEMTAVLERYIGTLQQRPVSEAPAPYQEPEIIPPPLPPRRRKGLGKA